MSCPRCGGPVRAPDLMHTDWRCADCGPVPPMRVAEHIGPEIVRSITDQIMSGTGEESAAGAARAPLWCPWPLPPGWTVTGAAWAGDDRAGVRATAVACSGPAPLGGGPADLVLVAEEPGVGLGARFAGIPGLDPGPLLTELMAPSLGDPGHTPGHPEHAPGHAEHVPHAKIRAGGHPTPMWSIKSPTDRSAYVGEARGMWLYAIAWPASAGYVLAEEVVLNDLTEWLPPELVYGAPSPYLHGKA